jgi:hypothetical protein
VTIVTLFRWVTTAFVLFVFLLARPARADESRRILIAVGHTEGLLDEAPLKHAGHDAARVRDLFVQMGRVRPADAILLQNPSVDALEGALRSAKDLVAQSPDHPTQVFFYFSGHGDRDQLHLGADVYPVATLSDRLGQIPAQLRVVVTDACRTASVRAKGAASKPGFAISLSPIAEAEGSVWLYASADGEAAQESDELAGAIFTHHLLNGLAGAADVNGDKRVTLEEAYEYAHGRTMARAFRGSGTVQRPTAKFDLRLHAPLTITEIGGNRATLRIPAAQDVYYLVSSKRAETTVAELWSAPERATSLSLPPGEYTVQRRAAGHVGLARVALAGRETRELGVGDFVGASTGDLVVAKGEGALLAERDHAVDHASLGPPKNELLGMYAVTASSRLPVLQGAGFQYTHLFGRVFVAGAFDATGGARRTSENHEVMTALGANARVGVELLSNPVALRVSLGPSLRYLMQDLSRLDSESIQAAGYPSTTSHRAWVPGLVLGAEVERAVVGPLFVYVGGRVEALALQVEDRSQGAFAASALGGLGLRL